LDVVGSIDRTCRLYRGGEISVAFSPNRKLLATAGLDNTARLWDPSTGREVLVLTGHTVGLTDVAFSPDGTRLATSSNDGSVRAYVLPIKDRIDLARSRPPRSWTEDECRQYPAPGKRVIVNEIVLVFFLAVAISGLES
jgi:WD40 repeat protein